jgi:rhomboid family GlyGly-CTERM serine protease
MAIRGGGLASVGVALKGGDKFAMPADVALDKWTFPAPWTLALAAVVVVLNLALFGGFEVEGRALLAALQFDGVAIRDGQLWRLLTGNLVHWDRQHFLLDVVALLVLGLMYERRFPCSYPLLLLAAALAVGIVGLVYWPPQTLCRGLSGITAAQFAAALGAEALGTQQNPSRWLWLGPAIALFLGWLVYGCVTGKSLLPFGLNRSENQQVAVLAHFAGAGTGACFVLLTWAYSLPDGDPSCSAEHKP